MITERMVIGAITVKENGMLECREDNVIEKDGKEISRTYRRFVLEPGEDVTQQPARIQSIAGVLWTPEVIEKRRREREEVENRMPR